MGNTEGSSDVSGNRQEVDTEVKEGVVISLDAIIFQGHSVIELGSCVHLKLARGNIHNMGDAQLGQLAFVPGCVPGGRAQGRLGIGRWGRSPLGDRFWLGSATTTATAIKGRGGNSKLVLDEGLL